MNPDALQHRRLTHARRHARRLAMQALYQWQLTDYHPKDILADFQGDPEMERADWEHFRHVLLGVTENVDAVDQLIAPFLDRPVAQVDPVERSILRLATFELHHCPDVPTRVAINEAVALAKKFGADQGHKFVNGVIDKVAGGALRR
ncbi:transcription antitermination factor NusB [Ectothiorhodospira variabilis]|uniref:transcription antitermination factor NusB n=1 Tax=Ectothiorhodospira variabilis TaxID=505694 RepID=UPI001EFB7524|nr:transcription antitermination factor NusB [Ectothiorhodospira variabilis]MCG5497180.1 transcription antitermination factor NusB [Ectothiorhodospira variabilis]